MKIVAFATTLLLGSLFGSPAPALEEKRTYKENLSFPGGSGARTLIVDLIQGQITVTAEERSDVAIAIVETITAKNPEALARARREARLDRGASSANSLRIYADGPFRCGDEARRRDDCRGSWNLPYTIEYDVELRVPRELDLRLATVNQGDIAVRGVRSRRFEVANVNGGIELKGLTGQGTATTVNGAVIAHFAQNPTGECRFATINGEIDLGLPRGAGAEIIAETQNGEILSDFAVAAGRPQPVRVESESGGRKVYRSSQPSFRIGVGGPTLELSNINGDLLIRDLDAPRK
jgi:Putative adhesin